MRADVTGSISFLVCLLSISVTSAILVPNTNLDTSSHTEKLDGEHTSVENNSSKKAEVIETTTQNLNSFNESFSETNHLKVKEEISLDKSYSNQNTSLKPEVIENNSSILRELPNSNGEIQSKMNAVPSLAGLNSNSLPAINNVDPNLIGRSFSQSDAVNAFGQFNSEHFPLTYNAVVSPASHLNTISQVENAEILNKALKSDYKYNAIGKEGIIYRDPYTNAINPYNSQYLPKDNDFNLNWNPIPSKLESSLYNANLHPISYSPNIRGVPHNVNPYANFSPNQVQNNAHVIDNISRDINMYRTEDVPKFSNLLPDRRSNDIQYEVFGQSPRGVQIIGSKYPQYPYNPSNIQIEAAAIPSIENVYPQVYDYNNNLISKDNIFSPQQLNAGEINNARPLSEFDMYQPTPNATDNSFDQVNKSPLQVRKTRRSDMILPLGYNNYRACSSEGEFYNAWNDVYQCMVCVCIKREGMLILTCASCTGCTQTPDQLPPIPPSTLMPTVNPPIVRPPPNSCHPLPVNKPFRHPGNPCLVCTCMNIVEETFSQIVPQINCDKLDNCPHPVPSPPSQNPSAYAACSQMPTKVWFPHPTEPCGVCQCIARPTTYGALENVLQCRDIPNCNKCLPLPFNAVFKHPLNSCQLCKCNIAQEVDGSPARLITCQVIPDCLNMEVIEYPPEPSPYVPQVPMLYPDCIRFPQDVLYPHPSDRCAWCKCTLIHSATGVLQRYVMCYREENCESLQPTPIFSTTSPSFTPPASTSPVGTNGCEPLPENTLFTHPLNPCVLCYCKVDMLGSQIKCTSSKGCQTTEPMPIVPVGPYPKLYDYCALFPNDVEFPHPTAPCKTCLCHTHALITGHFERQILCAQDTNCTLSWPSDVDPLPPPRPHESCAPYPPDQPFQHPWNECQVCKCWETKTQSGINVQVNCYTKPECCNEDLPSAMQTPGPKDIVITDEICEYRTFGLQFPHPKDNCQICACVLNGRFVYLHCKTTNNPMCIFGNRGQNAPNELQLLNNDYPSGIQSSGGSQMNVGSYTSVNSYKPSISLSSNPTEMKLNNNAWGSPSVQPDIFSKQIKAMQSNDFQPYQDQVASSANSFETEFQKLTLIANPTNIRSQLSTNKKFPYVDVTSQPKLINIQSSPVQSLTSSNNYGQAGFDIPFNNDINMNSQGNEYVYTPEAKPYPINILGEASASASQSSNKMKLNNLYSSDKGAQSFVSPYYNSDHGLVRSPYSSVFSNSPSAISSLNYSPDVQSYSIGDATSATYAVDDYAFNKYDQYPSMLPKLSQSAPLPFQTAGKSMTYALTSNAQNFYKNKEYSTQSEQYPAIYSNTAPRNTLRPNIWQSVSNQAVAQVSAQAAIGENRRQNVLSPNDDNK